MSKLDELIVNLERLEAHLDAIFSGSLVARDDLASVLQILLHDGEGHDLINKAFDEQGLPQLSMAAHQQPQINRSRNSQPVILAIRAVNSDASTPQPLDDVLNQEAIFHDNSVWSSSSSLTWKQVIAKSRNQYGSHIDDEPVRWLEDLRIYPVANADAMTFLLWSIGEALLGSLSAHLASNGADMLSYQRRKSLNGIEIQEGHVLSVPPTSIQVGADLMITDEHRSQRTIFGGIYNSTPFLFGINKNRQVVALKGNQGDSLEDLESHFLLGSAGDGLNRATRRAMRRR